MQDTWPAGHERCGVLSLLQASASGLHADELHAGRVCEGVEDADSIAAAAHAGYHHIGQSSRLRCDLLSRLESDYRLEIAHHAWIGMRPDNGADEVESRFDVRYPVANGLVDGIF